MKEVVENETYAIGAGNLILDAELGNGHLGTIEVKVNGILVASKNDEAIEGLVLGEKAGLINDGGILRVKAFSNVATPSGNGLFTVTLKDAINTNHAPFQYDVPFDGEPSIEFKIKFTLS